MREVPLHRDSGTLVTVVIPVFNTAAYLDVSLRSIASQSLRAIEIIVVDDGSTDESRTVLDRHARQDERIRPIYLPENRGQGHARNRGLDAARGRFVYFFDSDDVLKPGVLQRLYDLCEREQLDVCAFSGEVVYDRADFALLRRDQEQYNLREQVYPTVMQGQDAYAQLVHNRDHISSVPLHFYRRAHLIANHLRFLEDIIHEDEAFVFESLVRAGRVAVINDQLYVRRFRAGSTMTSLDRARSIEGNARTIEYMDAVRATLAPPPTTFVEAAIDAWQTRLRGNIQRLTDAIAPGGGGPAAAGPRVLVRLRGTGSPNDELATLATLDAQRLAGEVSLDTGDSPAAAGTARAPTHVLELEPGDLLVPGCLASAVALADAEGAAVVAIAGIPYDVEHHDCAALASGCLYREHPPAADADGETEAQLRYLVRASAGDVSFDGCPRVPGDLIRYRRSQRTWDIGYVSGVFDLFHVGHLNLLQRASDHCRRLIVGVLSDEAVARVKGRTPTIPLEDRVRIIAAVRYVDRAVVTTVATLDKVAAWNELGFDVMFSGDDHEHDHGWSLELGDLRARGVEVMFFPYTAGVSTTEIRELAGHGPPP